MSERKAAIARNAIRALYLVPAMIPVVVPMVVLGCLALIARHTHEASAAGAGLLQDLLGKMPDFEPLPGPDEQHDPDS